MIQSACFGVLYPEKYSVVSGEALPKLICGIVNGTGPDHFIGGTSRPVLAQACINPILMG